MSNDTLDALREAWAAFNEGDWDTALDHADPEIEWQFHGNLSLDSEQRIQGREAVRTLWEDFFGVWDEYRMETIEFIEAPDGRVVVPVRFTARGQGSGVPIEMVQFYVCTLRQKKFVAIDLFDERRKALEAAGLAGQLGDPEG